MCFQLEVIYLFFSFSFYIFSYFLDKFIIETFNHLTIEAPNAESEVYFSYLLVEKLAATLKHKTVIIYVTKKVPNWLVGGNPDKKKMSVYLRSSICLVGKITFFFLYLFFYLSISEYNSGCLSYKISAAIQWHMSPGNQ